MSGRYLSTCVYKYLYIDVYLLESLESTSELFEIITVNEKIVGIPAQPTTAYGCSYYLFNGMCKVSHPRWTRLETMARALSLCGEACA